METYAPIIKDQLTRIKIQMTGLIPSRQGLRNRNVGQLAFRLKSNDELTDLPWWAFRGVIRWYWKRCYGNADVAWNAQYSPDSVESGLEETFEDFRYAWEQGERRGGCWPDIAERAAQKGHHPFTDCFKKTKIKQGVMDRLIWSCVILAEDRDEFFVPCRAAGKALKETPMTISRYLKRLVEAGFLVRTRDAQIEQRASCYYRSNSEDTDGVPAVEL